MTTKPNEGIKNTDNPKAVLEKKFIEEYLREQGYLMDDLKKMPAEFAEELMKEATRYATLKLEGISAGARFVEGIHGSSSHR